MKAIKDSAKSFSKDGEVTLLDISLGNNQAAHARCLRELSASFARRLRNNASTAASSGFRLSMPLGKLALGFRLELKDQIPVHVGVQHFRMGVALAANGRRVAELAQTYFSNTASACAGDESSRTLAATASSAAARSKAEVGLPRWSATTETSSRVSLSESIVRTKFAPYGLKSQFKAVYASQLFVEGLNSGFLP